MTDMTYDRRPWAWQMRALVASWRDSVRGVALPYQARAAIAALANLAEAREGCDADGAGGVVREDEGPPPAPAGVGGPGLPGDVAGG